MGPYELQSKLFKGALHIGTTIGLDYGPYVKSVPISLSCLVDWQACLRDCFEHCQISQHESPKQLPPQYVRVNTVKIPSVFPVSGAPLYHSKSLRSSPSRKCQQSRSPSWTGTGGTTVEYWGCIGDNGNENENYHSILGL